MRIYLNKPLQELATELTAGLWRLRKGYVDSADALLRILDDTTDYSLEFITYRLTGFRPSRQSQIAQTVSGKSLKADLQQLMLDVCDSLPLRPADYDERCWDIPALARHMQVSSKTIQRWQRLGLPARRLVFPDGRRRVAFTAGAVEWFTGLQRDRVLRSTKFTQMTAAERDEIVRRARRMAAFAHCTLTEVARRLATRTGRSVEAIRYSIRNHDRANPGAAIFPYLAGPVPLDERRVIFTCFLNGVSAPALALKYHRTRSSIYRIINEMRARQLVQRQIPYVYNPTFDLPNADEIAAAEHHLPADQPAAAASVGNACFAGQSEVPLLDDQQERDLFRRYNYLKHKADKLRRQININHVRVSLIGQIESLLLSANVFKNQIIKANLRLVVAIAKKHVSPTQSLLELVSDGNVTLMQAVEKFDYSRGFRFSTYASWAIMRSFARTVPREQFQLDRFATGNDELIDIAAGLKSYDPHTLNLGELRESIDSLLARLTPQERTIITDHYGLNRDGQTESLDQLGRRLGLSRESIRKIEIRAMDKLRLLAQPGQEDEHH